jgi:hypothetical protein
MKKFLFPNCIHPESQILCRKGAVTQRVFIFLKKTPKFMSNMILYMIDVVVLATPVEGTRPTQNKKNSGFQTELGLAGCVGPNLETWKNRS